MKTLTFSSNGASITVREPVGRDLFTRPAVQGVLMNYLQKKYGIEELTDPMWAMVIGYEKILSRTVSVEGHIPFELPSPNAPHDVINAGFEAVMEAPEALINDWTDNLDAVGKTPMETVTEGKTTGE